MKRRVAWVSLFTISIAAVAFLVIPQLGIQSSLCRAAFAGNVPRVSALLQRGTDPNKCELYPRHHSVGCASPIVWAAIGNQAETIRILSAFGADIGRSSGKVNEPLMWSIYHRNVESVQALLEVGASASSCDRDGQPLIYMAAATGQVKVVTALLEHGASLEISDKKGVTALELVCGNMNVGAAADVIQTALQHGLSPNATIGQSETVLMFAAEFLDVATVSKLVASGADVSLVDASGAGAADYARRRADGRCDAVIDALHRR